MSQEDSNASNSGGLAQVPDQSETIDRLRDENVQLRQEIAQLRAGKTDSSNNADWPMEMANGIVYADGHSPTSSTPAGRVMAQLSGLSRERMKAGRIRNSHEFDYLPKPSLDQTQLEADYVRWGYCLVQDAMSGEQVQAQVDRLTEQAAAEREQNVAIVSGHNDSAQLVNNLVLKGEVFRAAVEFNESAAQNGPLVDRLLTRIMGENFGLGCAHGSIVHTGGGLQELHIDQGGIPMPYPPYPFGSLIIWCYTDFNLDNGGTYLVPGSHRTASGSNLFHGGADLMQLVDSEPGLVALCAPPGTCVVTDTRMLHCGGRRQAPGTRYAMRCHYNRSFIRALHEQANANVHVPDEVYERLSPRLKQMMSITVNEKQPVLELKPATPAKGERN